MFKNEIKNFYNSNPEMQKFYRDLVHEKLTEKPKLSEEQNYFDFYREYERLLNCFNEIINERDWDEYLKYEFYSYYELEEPQKVYRVDDRDYENLTILSAAIKVGFEKLVEFLLREGANPNTPNGEWTEEEIDDYSEPYGGVATNRYFSIRSYPLHEAIENDREDIVILLLDYGADRQLKNEEGQTSLHLAAQKGNLTIVKLLLEYKLEKPFDVQAYIAQKDGGEARFVNKKYGKTVMHFAAESFAVDVIKYLQQRSEQPLEDIQDEGGKIPLDCIRSIQTETKSETFLAEKQKIIQSIAALTTVDADIKVLVTKLFNAIEKDDLQTIQELLTTSPDLITARNSYTNTPLFEAIYSKKWKAVDYLIKQSVNVNARCFEGKSPLHIAVNRQAKDVIVQLIAAGAEVNAKDDYGATPILDAARIENKDLLELLLKHGAVLKDLLGNYARNTIGQNCIHLAVSENCTRNLQYFMQLFNNDVRLFEQPDGYGRTPIHYAAEKGYEGVFKLLIKLGSKRDYRDHYGRAPIHLAAEKNKLAIIEHLVTKDDQSQLEWKDKYERTPLHIAASSGALDTVQFLLKNNADLKALDNKGRTPLHLAARDGQYEMLQFLLDKGANPLQKDKKGDTPLAVANRHNKNYKNKMGRYDEQKYLDACDCLRQAENKYYGHKSEKRLSGSYQENQQASHWHHSRNQSGYSNSRQQRDNNNVNSNSTSYSRSESKSESLNWRKS